MRDLRYAARALRRTPWYSLTAIVVLAAGMALATTTFAVVDGVLFKPLPFPHAQDLYIVRADTSTARTLEPSALAGWDLTAWHEAVPDLAVTVVRDPQPWSRADGRDYGTLGVDERFFDVLGLKPLYGGFASDDFDFTWSDPPPVAGSWLPVMISYRRWQQDYGGDPGVVGRKVVSRVSRGREAGFQIRGVLPREFVFPLDLGAIQPDVLVPVRARDARRGFDRQYRAIARIAPADVAGVRDRLRTATRRLTGTIPIRDPDMRHHFPPAELERLRVTSDDVDLVPIAVHLGRRSRQSFAIVVAAAGLLLLLACVNVAGLVAARRADRARELTVRRTLGASTWALARALLVEVALLAGLATAAALVAVRPLLAWTMTLLPSSIALLKAPEIDVRVFGAAAVCTLACIVVVAAWPARVSRRLSLVSPLGSLGSAVTRRGRRADFALVAVQVAMGFVLLTAGALTVTSVARAWRNDVGFDRERIVLIEAYLKDPNNSGAGDRVLALMDTLRAVNGVRAVAATSARLFEPGMTPWTGSMPKGWSGPVTGVQTRSVTAGYFELMDLRVIEGRMPAASEWRNDALLVVVSRTAARMLWPDRSAVGQVMVPARPRPGEPVREQRVIAVVADVPYEAIDRDPIGEVYVPGAIGPGTYGSRVLVRTDDRAAGRVLELAAITTARGFRIDRATTLEDALFVTVRHRALPAWLFGSLGAIALVVLAAGILGLIAMVAGQRTREIGVRCALGASSSQVMRLLVGEQLRAVAAGLFAGVLVSLWAVRGLEAQLYRVSVYDATVWVGVGATVFAVAALATLVPAVRASRVDPVQALRVE